MRRQDITREGIKAIRLILYGQPKAKPKRSQRRNRRARHA